MTREDADVVEHAHVIGDTRWGDASAYPSR
jgi:hypothetical protein